MGSGVLAVLFPDTVPLRPELTAEAIRLNGNQSGLIPHDVVQLLTVGTALSSACAVTGPARIHHRVLAVRAVVPQFPGAAEALRHHGQQPHGTRSDGVRTPPCPGGARRAPPGHHRTCDPGLMTSCTSSEPCPHRQRGYVRVCAGQQSASRSACPSNAPQRRTSSPVPRSKYIHDLSGAKEIRTPDLLHAMNHPAAPRPGHMSPDQAVR